jgi:hypothetical protein
MAPLEGSSDSLVAVIASASLFVATVILSQCNESNRRIRSSVCDDCREFLFPGNFPTQSAADSSEDDDDDDDDDGREEALRCYALRRNKDRLSFHNFNGMAKPASVEEEPEGDFSLNSAVESAADFHPRNKNWKHFERDSSDTDTCIIENTGTVPGVHSSIEGDDEAAGFWYTSRPEGTMRARERSMDPADPTLLTTKIFPALNRGVSVDDQAMFNHKERQRRTTLAGSTQEEPNPNALAQSQLRRSSSTPASASSNSPEAMNRRPSDEHDRTLSNHVRHQNRAARASYNARIIPDTLTLIRHGQSLGNVDEKLYSTTPDNAMPLTKLGWEQAKQAGRALKERFLRQGAEGGVHFIVSPYVRTVETFHGIVSAWCDPSEFNHIKDRDQRLKAWYSRLLELGLTWHEDPRIREQGTLLCVCKRATKMIESNEEDGVWGPPLRLSSIQVQGDSINDSFFSHAVSHSCSSCSLFPLA